MPRPGRRHRRRLRASQRQSRGAAWTLPLTDRGRLRAVPAPLHASAARLRQADCRSTTAHQTPGWPPVTPGTAAASMASSMQKWSITRRRPAASVTVRRLSILRAAACPDGGAASRAAGPPGSCSVTPSHHSSCPPRSKLACRLCTSLAPGSRISGRCRWRKAAPSPTCSTTHCCTACCCRTACTTVADGTQLHLLAAAPSSTSCFSCSPPYSPPEADCTTSTASCRPASGAVMWCG